jgi:dephospho-CoA kinase
MEKKDGKTDGSGEQKKQSACRIGVTGTIGSGKSEVGKILTGQGIPVLDVDKVVHVLLDSDSDVQKKIREHFGSEFLKENADGTATIDRVKLGKLVFADKDARKELEKIVHPAVLVYSEKWIEEQRTRVIALLIPLLFEASRAKSFDQIWTVTCDEHVLRDRLKARNGLSDADIDRRLAAQLSQEEKASLAHSIIDNSGTIDETTAQVLSLLMEIRLSLEEGTCAVASTV